MTETILQVNQVSYAYGATPILRDVSFSLSKGAIACLLGPSACGKTTLLRGIAGFEPVESGEIFLNQKLASRKGFTEAPERRKIGMVFQDFALFPHLTVEKNIAFGLKTQDRQVRRERVAELLDTVGLSNVAARYPTELSGGQQQRVALARALAPRPQLLLLDEPFSNLDIDLRERLCIEVREILKANNATAVIVTHDQNEAFAIADVIGMLADGTLQQWGTSYELYHQPANRLVADFIGQGVFVNAKVINRKQLETELGILDGDFSFEPDTRVELLLRPDDILHDDHSQRVAQVIAKAFRGAEFLYTLQMPSGLELFSLVPSHHDHAVGSHIGIRLAIDHIVAFPVHTTSRQSASQQHTWITQRSEIA